MRNPLKLMNLMTGSRILSGIVNFTKPTSFPRYIHCAPTYKSDIKTTLQYYDPASEKTKWVDTTIKDGRGQKFSLEKNGFEVVKDVTNISAKEHTPSDYCKELEVGIAKHLGAATVQILMEPIVRKHETGDTDKEIVHSVVPSEAFSAALGKQFLRGRYILFGICRNLTGIPVAANDIAVLDISSVNYPDDVAATGDVIKDADLFRLLDANKDNHNWFYFSDMNKDDVLLISHWDSENPLDKMCFHALFRNPDAKTKSPPYEFCSVVAYAFFPFQEPWNTVCKQCLKNSCECQ